MASEGYLVSLKTTRGGSPEPFVETAIDDPDTLQQIKLFDSALKYYPYMEVDLNDAGGLISEMAYFSEGVELEATMMTRQVTPLFQESALRHTFYMTEQHIQDTIRAKYVQGSILWPALSQHHKDDREKVRAFPQTTTTAVLNQVYNRTNYQSFGRHNAINRVPVSLLTSPTIGLSSWYQGATSDRDFVERMAYRSVGGSNPFSPVLAFHNLKGEFRFMTVADMMNQAPIQGTYELVGGSMISPGKQPSYFSILNFSIQNGGASANKDNYRRSVWRLNDDGTFAEDIVPLAAFAAQGRSAYEQSMTSGVPTGPPKILVRQSDAFAVQSRDYYGVTSLSELPNYRGYKNSLFINSIFPYRIRATIYENPEAVAGRTFRLRVSSAIQKRGGMSPEYTGIWCIVSSAHAKVASRRQPAYTEVLLGRPAMHVHRDHRYYAEFLDAAAAASAGGAGGGG